MHSLAPVRAQHHHHHHHHQGRTSRRRTRRAPAWGGRCCRRCPAARTRRSRTPEPPRRPSAPACASPHTPPARRGSRTPPATAPAWAGAAPSRRRGPARRCRPRGSRPTPTCTAAPPRQWPPCESPCATHTMQCSAVRSGRRVEGRGGGVSGRTCTHKRPPCPIDLCVPPYPQAALTMRTSLRASTSLGLIDGLASPPWPSLWCVPSPHVYSCGEGGREG